DPTPPSSYQYVHCRSYQHGGALGWLAMSGCGAQLPEHLLQIFFFEVTDVVT
ncbi:hypothetical protein HAX54_017079, partial [Datura stramonium]|nr:hypothetical protein [Datura stramonium]